MSDLNTARNIANPDDVYEMLIRMHDGRSDAESVALNTRLILCLANHIGDAQVLRQAIAATLEDFNSAGGAVRP